VRDKPNHRLETVSSDTIISQILSFAEETGRMERPGKGKNREEEGDERGLEKGAEDSRQNRKGEKRKG